jgi:hypothetical protein
MFPVRYELNVYKLLRKNSSFLSKRNFGDSVEGEMFTLRDIQAGVPQGSVLSPTLYNIYIYINDTSQTYGVYLGLFADDTSIYAIDRKEGYVLRNFQRGLSATETWYERWNLKINEDKSEAIYVYNRFRPPEAHFILNGRTVPFINHIKYLVVIFDERITWRLHIEMTEANAFRTFIRIYSVFRSERLSANIILTFHKALIKSLMTYAYPAWELAADN